MSTTQYGVRWQREGRPAKFKRFGNRRARAENMVLYLQGDFEAATGHKRDERRDDFGAVTWGDYWDQRAEELNDPEGTFGAMPPLLFVRLETREVEPWHASPSPETEETEQ